MNAIKVIVNRKAGTCKVCGCVVKPGEGKAALEPLGGLCSDILNGRWRVFCLLHAPERAPRRSAKDVPMLNAESLLEFDFENFLKECIKASEALGSGADVETIRNGRHHFRKLVDVARRLKGKLDHERR